MTSANAKLTFSGSETGSAVTLGTFTITVPANNTGPVATPAETFLDTSSGNVSWKGKTGFDWFYLPSHWFGIITIDPGSDRTGLGGVLVGANVPGSPAVTAPIGGSGSSPMTYNGSNQWAGTDPSGGTYTLTFYAGTEFVFLKRRPIPAYACCTRRI